MRNTRSLGRQTASVTNFPSLKQPQNPLTLSTSQCPVDKLSPLILLSGKERAGRRRLFTELMLIGHNLMELKLRTLELTLRMIDLYCVRTQNKPKTMLHRTDNTLAPRAGNRLFLEKEIPVAFGAALFMCAKYEEVYPPTIYDFRDSFFRLRRVSHKDILEKETELAIVTGLDFTIYPTVSNYYESKGISRLPPWAHECYILLPGMDVGLLADLIERAEAEEDERATQSSDNDGNDLFKLKLVLKWAENCLARRSK